MSDLHGPGRTANCRVAEVTVCGDLPKRFRPRLSERIADKKFAYILPRANDFAASRACLMKRSAGDVRVRFFKVTITIGDGRIGNLTDVRKWARVIKAANIRVE